jgi:hypothetical protein
MTLHWGQSHIAACLPEYLLARFNEAYADPNQSPDATTGLPIFNGKTGELLMEMGADRPVRVSRKKMRNLFKEGLDVQFGKAFSGAEMKGEKVEVTFEDGSKAIGDVLVVTARRVGSEVLFAAKKLQRSQTYLSACSTSPINSMPNSPLKSER